MLGIAQLERRIKQNFKLLVICQEAHQRLGDYLEILRKHDFETYYHSLQVGFIGAKAALFLSLDPKPIFYAGLARDLGKIGVSLELLRKTKGFAEEDHEETKKYPVVGYSILKEGFPFSAEILLRCRRFQKDSYPDCLPDNRYALEEIALIEEYARLLALADSYENLTSKENERLGGIKDKEKVQAIMIERNPDQELLIRGLFLQGIF